MNQSAKALLVSSRWLGRTLRVAMPDAEYVVEYLGRGWGAETVRVNGELEIKTSNNGWFTPIFNFFLGRHRAVIELRVAPWCTFRSFHLVVDSKVLYCERSHGRLHPDEMSGAMAEADFGPYTELSPSADRLVCPFCGRCLRGVSFKEPDLPDALLTKRASIGTPYAEFIFSRSRQIRFLVLGILCGLGTTLLWTVLFLIHRGPNGMFQIHWHAHLLGILGIAAGIFLPYYALKGPHPHAVAGTNGLGLVDGEAAQAFSWKDIREIFEVKWNARGGHWAAIRAIAKGENHTFTILTESGERMVLNNWLKDLDGLGRILYRETLPVLLPRVVAVIAAGDSVQFGRISVTADGIEASRTKLLFWSEVKKVTVVDQKLKIYKKRKSLVWFSAPMGEIPNLHVFKALVREFASDSEA